MEKFFAACFKKEKLREYTTIFLTHVNSDDEDAKSPDELRREKMQKQFFSGSLSSQDEDENTVVVTEDVSVKEETTEESAEPAPPLQETPLPPPPPPESKETFEWHEHKPHNRFVSFLLLILNFLIIAAVVLLIRTFVVSPFAIVGHSMDESFADGELILVDKLSYRFEAPQRGEVIVFHPPIDTHTIESGWLCTLKKLVTDPLPYDFGDVCRTRQYYVKRIIGIPGDRVRIQDGQVYVTPEGGDEQQIRTDFLTDANRDATCFSQNCNSELDIRGSIVDVQPDTVFVLGDNRTGSSDSRAWKIGGVPAPFASYDDISGKVRAVFFPFTNVKIVGGLDILTTPQNEENLKLLNE